MIIFSNFQNLQNCLSIGNEILEGEKAAVEAFAIRQFNETFRFWSETTRRFQECNDRVPSVICVVQKNKGSCELSYLKYTMMQHWEKKTRGFD